VSATQAGDREGALAAVSDRMCDAIDVVGSADLVAATVRAYVAAGVDVPVLMPLPWGGDRTQVIADTIRAAARPEPPHPPN
jgi:alkanesulfonate monooxygenase SsuD/methylene tetrahydromethanopterin reductase-like flavin-dependent oxidoreductase (luciferase family)